MSPTGPHTLVPRAHQKPMLNLRPPKSQRAATDVAPCTSHHKPMPLRADCPHAAPL